MLIYISLIFATLGLYGAVIVSLDSFLKVLELLSFPIYLTLFQTAFCAIGQHLKNSVCSLSKIF